MEEPHSGQSNQQRSKVMLQINNLICEFTLNFGLKVPHLVFSAKEWNSLIQIQILFISMRKNVHKKWKEMRIIKFKQEDELTI